MEITVEALVTDVGELVSLPEVAVRLNEMVDDPDCSAGDIAKAIGGDPALTARLLRIANSPLYGFTSEIDTVTRAVTVLGTKQVRDLALATSAADAFSGIPNRLVSMENFWYHSLYCALAAQQLATAVQGRRLQADVLFVAGLLHDIGELVIFHELPELARESLLLSAEGADELELYQAERQLIGFDHAQLGGALARHWHLPVVLEECIEFHHEPEKAGRHPMEVAAVHVANSLAYLAELHSENAYEAPEISPRAWELLGLDSSVSMPVVAEAQARIGEVQAVFFPDGAARRGGLSG